MSRTDDPHLGYHERCRAVCDRMGLILLRSSYMAGFRGCTALYTRVVDVDHYTMEFIEIVVSETKNSTRDDKNETTKYGDVSPWSRYGAPVVDPKEQEGRL